MKKSRLVQSLSYVKDETVGASVKVIGSHSSHSTKPFRFEIVSENSIESPWQISCIGRVYDSFCRASLCNQVSLAGALPSLCCLLLHLTLSNLYSARYTSSSPKSLYFAQIVTETQLSFCVLMPGPSDTSSHYKTRSIRMPLSLQKEIGLVQV